MKCPMCGLENDPSAAFCDQCGASLSSTAPQPQPPAQSAAGVPQQETPPAPQPFPPPPEMIGEPVTPCHLLIGGQLVPVPLKKEALVGRAEIASGWNPDVDLTPYGGTPNAGISRTHLKIVWQGAWMIEDMNSTNGTFLRGQRLAPGQRMPINNGEMFQVGKLQITFFAR